MYMIITASPTITIGFHGMTGAGAPAAGCSPTASVSSWWLSSSGPRQPPMTSPMAPTMPRLGPSDRSSRWANDVMSAPRMPPTLQTP